MKLSIAVYEPADGLLAHTIYTQTDIHAPFGGVVPELASRDHVRKLIPLIDQVLGTAGISVRELDGVAYTKGPGLVGALMAGAMLGRALGFCIGLCPLLVYIIWKGICWRRFLRLRPRRIHF